MDNLTLLTAEILNAFDDDEILASLSIDIKGAYDNILRGVLIETLKDIGVSELYLRIVHNLVGRKHLTFRYEEIDEKRTVFKGLAQGGVLSSILYALHTSPLEDIPLERCQLMEFADDTTYYAISKKPERAIKNLENTMIDIMNFLDSRGLEPSPGKNQLCVFSRSKKITSKIWSLKIRGKTINSNSVFKLLGL